LRSADDILGTGIKVKTMKKFLLWLVLCLGSLLAGCGTLDSYSEREQRYNSWGDLNARQFVDDWDYFWLVERNSRLSQWHAYIGY